MMIRPTLLLLLTLLAGGGAAAADRLVVIASTAAAYPPGALLANGERIDLPAGQQLKLLAADGRIAALAGPWQGRLDSTPGEPDDDLLTALAGVISAAHSSDLTMATFRNSGIAAGAATPEVWGVHLDHPGAYCLRADLPATLYWPRAFRGARITLSNDAGDAAATVDWDSRGDDRPWPPALAIVDGGAYTARVDISPRQRGFTLHRVPDRIDNDAGRLAWLAARGCDRQARALLANLARRTPTVVLPAPEAR